MDSFCIKTWQKWAVFLYSSVGEFLLFLPLLIFSVTSVFPQSPSPYIHNPRIWPWSFCPHSSSLSVLGCGHLMLLKLHFPITAGEGSHRSPATLTPPPGDPVLHLYGIIFTWNCWGNLNKYALKKLPFNNKHWLHFTCDDRHCKDFFKEPSPASSVLFFCFFWILSASHWLDKLVPRRLLQNATSHREQKSSFGTAAPRLELAYFTSKPA